MHAEDFQLLSTAFMASPLSCHNSVTLRAPRKESRSHTRRSRLPSQIDVTTRSWHVSISITLRLRTRPYCVRAQEEFQQLSPRRSLETAPVPLPGRSSPLPQTTDRQSRAAPKHHPILSSHLTLLLVPRLFYTASSTSTHHHAFPRGWAKTDDRYSWAPYEHHGWEFDGYLMRLLHLAGRWTICTRDDPSQSTAQMLSSP